MDTPAPYSPSIHRIHPMNHPPAMKTGVSCSKVIAELAVVKTKATIKEMLAPEDTTDFDGFWSCIWIGNSKS